MREKTEMVIAEYDNAEMLNDIFNNPVVETLLSRISSIPVACLLVNTMKTLISDMQIKKQQELFECIINDNNVTLSDINNNVVIFEFYKTLEVVNRLAGREKIKYLGNLFSGFAKSEEKNIDDYEEMLISFSDLTFREIEILYYLYVTENSMASLKSEENVDESVKIIWDTFVVNYKNRYPDVIFESVMLKAMRNGFCMCEWLTYYGSSKIIAYTTHKFGKFVERSKLDFG